MLAVQAHGCTGSDAQCCCFSYHTLFNLKYDHRAGKTAVAKRWAVEKNISVWEAERQLGS